VPAPAKEKPPPPPPQQPKKLEAPKPMVEQKEQKEGPEIRQTDKEALAFLRTQAALFQDDTPSFHEELIHIWDQLGFTTTQKLAVVVKYSSSPEESALLKDVLAVWQKALDLVENYHRAYKGFTEFLRHAPHADQMAPAHWSEAFASHSTELSFAEGNLRALVVKLKETYGDELIVKRRPIMTLMADRRTKLTPIIAQYS
jgi:hypothetical protein